MHLLYLDDSGSVKNAADKHIILAGLSVFERLPHWLSRSLDAIAKEVWEQDPDNLEFRGVNIFAGASNGVVLIIRSVFKLIATHSLSLQIPTMFDCSERRSIRLRIRRAIRWNMHLKQ